MDSVWEEILSKMGKTIFVLKTFNFFSLKEHKIKIQIIENRLLVYLKYIK